MRPTFTRIAIVLFVSGFCSLVYQVAWLRLLRLVFGSSTASTAVVLAIFMGGLGLGGLVLGRRAERAAQPLDFYAKLETGIALAAAVSPFLILLVRQLYLGVGGVNALGTPTATALRLLLAALVLGVPTTLMGGTLPAVAQAMEQASDRGRRIVAELYGINTLGAVAGALATTFVLIELLGVRQSLWLAAALNLLLAMVVRSMARHGAVVAGKEEDEKDEELREPADDGLKRPARVLVLAAAFLVGFIFFLMELVWYRMLAPVLGGTSYTFGLILCLALAGIGTGGWLYSRGARDRRPTLEALAWTCALEALFLIIPFALGDDLAYMALVLRLLKAQGFAALTLGWAIVAGVVVLPTSVVAGYQFPLLVALLGAGRRSVGSEVGLAYAWNTWGAILGALAGGLGLLPLMTAPRLWRAAAIALALAAAALALAVMTSAVARQRRRRIAMPLLCATLAVLLTLTPGPSAYWRHTGIGAGRADAVYEGPNELRRKYMSARRSLVAEAEGVESSVALVADEGLSLQVNGKSDGGLPDAPTTIWLGLVGAMLHPSPKKVLVIGLGTGMTAGWLTQVPEVERIDIIELEPAVTELAGFFDPITFRFAESPKVRVIHGDGREYMRTTSETYDLIISEPSNPYRAGVADLFSREYYQAAAARLEPGGFFQHWLQGYEIDPEVVAMAYATLHSVFPQVESWQLNLVDLMLLATREPLVHDLARVRQRSVRSPFREALARTWYVSGAEGFYSAYVGGPGLADLIVARSPEISTDDRPRIEYGFARNVGRTGLFSITELQDLANEADAAVPAIAGGTLAWGLIHELRSAREAAGSLIYSSALEEGTDQERRRSARAAYREGQLPLVTQIWSSQGDGPKSLFDAMMMAEAGLEQNGADPEPLLAVLDAAAPTEALLLRARRLHAAGDAPAAREHLSRALAALGRDPLIYEPIFYRSLPLMTDLASADPAVARRLFTALEEPFASYRFEKSRLLKRIELAAKTGTPEHCAEAFAAYEPYVIWEKDFLANRWRCYRDTGHPLAERARTQLEDFYADSPRPLLELGPASP